jgi:hypothetical protein
MAAFQTFYDVKDPARHSKPRHHFTHGNIRRQALRPPGPRPRSVTQGYIHLDVALVVAVDKVSAEIDRLVQNPAGSP